jgi:hypothetical protein
MEESDGVPSHSVTVGGQEASRERALEERARHSGMNEGDRAKKGNGGGQRILWWPGGAGGKEKGQGVQSLAPHGGENGKREGAGVVGDSSSGRHRTPDGRRGRRCCRMTGEGQWGVSDSA